MLLHINGKFTLGNMKRSLVKFGWLKIRKIRPTGAILSAQCRFNAHGLKYPTKRVCLTDIIIFSSNLYCSGYDIAETLLTYLALNNNHSYSRSGKTILIFMFYKTIRDRRGRDRMVVGLKTTNAISAYHH